MDETTPDTPSADPNLAQLPPPAYPSPATIYSSPTPQTNVWAVISLVSSVLAWCGLFGIGGIVAIITGVVARNEIAASRGTQSGDGIALAGIILGAVNVIGTCFALLCFGLAFGLPVMLLPFVGR